MIRAETNRADSSLPRAVMFQQSAFQNPEKGHRTELQEGHVPREQLGLSLYSEVWLEDRCLSQLFPWSPPRPSPVCSLPS